MLEEVSIKLERDAKYYLEDAALLSHVISECLEFDESVRENFGYTVSRDGSVWKGTVDTFISSKERFKVWLEAERKCNNVMVNV